MQFFQLVEVSEAVAKDLLEDGATITVSVIDNVIEAKVRKDEDGWYVVNVTEDCGGVLTRKEIYCPTAVEAIDYLKEEEVSIG